jgi:hypothetical protein
MSLSPMTRITPHDQRLHQTRGDYSDSTLTARVVARDGLDDYTTLHEKAWWQKECASHRTSVDTIPLQPRCGEGLSSFTDP